MLGKSSRSDKRPRSPPLYNRTNGVTHNEFFDREFQDGACRRMCERASSLPLRLAARVPHALRVSSGGGGGSWLGAGAATGTLLIDGAIARTKDCRHPHPTSISSGQMRPILLSALRAATP